MKNSVKIALVQADLVWESVEKNLQKIDRLLQGVEDDTAIVVLPEMFATAFTVTITEKTALSGQIALSWLKKKAKELQKIVVGSILFEDSGHYYNRLFWVFPDGRFQYYDKRHLFQMGGEHQSITAGNKRVVVSYQGVRFLLQVCYDLRFPVASKNTYNPSTDTYEYDVILYVANWPEIRKHAYMSLLKARAIENQSYVIWVNRVGTDANTLMHSGDTQLINPLGEELATASAYKEEICHGTIAPDSLQKIRKGFKVGLDWDSFTIH